MARFLPALGCACALIAPTSALAAAPANDDFANAAVIPAAGTRSVIGTTAEATAQPFEPAGSAPLTTVWYSWTPAKNERVSIDTCALDDVNDADTVLDVFTGAAFVSLTMLATNDDDLPYCGAGRHGSHVVFNATANTPYSIRVDGYQNTVGGFTLAVSPYPSGGDLIMSTGELDFPNTPVGSMSPAQTLRLLNASATAMAFGKIAPSRDNYLIASDSCSNQTVAADGECSLHLRFAPQTAGYHFDFLSIAATNNPPLNGMATALPAGPTGPAGPQGQAGADGTNGKDGSDGAIGPVGPTGSSGAVGPAGPTGATGAVGPAGPVGASGPIGPQGPAGTAALVRCKRHHKKVKCRRRLTRNRPKG